MTGDGFRADIEGLRGVAIVAVLLCHAGLPFAAGGYVGVDVFFVISGFLITSLLVRELEGKGTISLRRFYARRVKRLLPMASLVLLTVVVLSQLLFSPLRNEIVSGDVIASLFYYVNWHFSAQAIDYFGETVSASPVLHYWTLAIEEQFYLVWPGMMLAASWWWRRSGREVRPVLCVLVVVVAATSLIYSLLLTSETPTAAYFSSFTRAWELALGASIALFRLPALRSPAAGGLALAGMTAIVVSVLSYDALTPFPGTAALLPTLGAAALIIAGPAGSRGPVGRALALGPVTYTGRISYAWYLWHWPFLIFAAEIWGPLSTAEGVLVVAASFIPTVLSHHLLEEPVRGAQGLVRRPRRALLLWAGASGATAAAAISLVTFAPTIETAPLSAAQGAAILDRNTQLQLRADVVRPTPHDAEEDQGPLARDGCLLEPPDTDSPPCVYGNPSSERTVVLLGDSHAMMFFPPLERLATKHDWRLVALTKAGCTPSAVLIRNDQLGREYTECASWRERALKRIEAERPRLVVVNSSTRHKPLHRGVMLKGAIARDTMEAGYVATLNRLSKITRVGLIKDPPRPPWEIPECVSEFSKDLKRCAFPLPNTYADGVDARAAAKADGITLVDVTEAICPDRLCHPVIGNVLVYRKHAHLTATFAISLAPLIEAQLPNPE